MDFWELKHAERWRRSKADRLQYWPIDNRQSIVEYRNTWRLAEPHCNALCGSCLSRQIILRTSGDMECPFVFEADMHPEREAATLNKCKPQKV
jgi:hypothetical protein